MMDYSKDDVKKVIAEIAKETGKTEHEVLKECEYAMNNKTYVRFIKGENKGKVGFYFPVPGELNPYSRVVYCKDCKVLTMGWNNNYEVISEEEYLKESADDV